MFEFFDRSVRENFVLIGAMGLVLLAMPCVLGAGEEAPAGARPLQDPIPLSIFFALADSDPNLHDLSADLIFENWQASSMPMVLEIARFSGRTREILARLEKVTEQRFEGDYDRALRFMWSQEIPVHPQYAEFKKRLYERIDPRFAAYFEGAAEGTRIRLNEIRWGGVRRDGIPPLDRPAMIDADAAAYLGDDDIVFGLEVAGDARAYPKRILAWHEMFKDTVGNVSVNGVYCTLCGSMILYETVHNGTHHEFGTSGFLYRSNKLMYDHATESLWSTITGEPVVGPLVGQGIQLKPRAVVTTTWKEWRDRHPDTQVLSLETGYLRDYSEGAAYHDYFATDDLMFTVPRIDSRLANKAEVLALRFGVGGTPPTAIEADWLRAMPVFHGRLGSIPYLILTDESGANRVYDAGELQITSYDGDRTAKDSEGRTWRISEDSMEGPNGLRRVRLPAHRAFWFGWHAAHPDTILIRRSES